MSDDFKEICHHIWLTGWAEFWPFLNDNQGPFLRCKCPINTFVEFIWYSDMHKIIPGALVSQVHKCIRSIRVFFAHTEVYLCTASIQLFLAPTKVHISANQGPRQLHMYLCVSSSFLQPTFYSQVTAVIPSFPYARWSTLSSIHWHWHTILFKQKKKSPKYNTFNPQARQEGQIPCSDIRKTCRQHALGSQPKKLHMEFLCRQSYF